MFAVVTMAELRCDVIVDDISSIDIETTTKELYLDDSPEEFVLRGMNEEGDFIKKMNHLLSFCDFYYHQAMCLAALREWYSGGI